ncbi:hypothetical protein [Streptacidiphilus albus]|uniref:hypothetical protein n=1 Tax=Streptacidiphilus albus TaxID=105425 RepID=UPI00054B02E2|nr:hypothetical protein [Streptacidiphilus albus]
MSLADAPDREAAWLATTGDGLPSLLTADGGPWDVIQAYAPRTPNMRQTQLYVIRRRYPTARFAQQRRMATHYLQLTATWPVGQGSTGTGIAENEQRALDVALALVVTRLEGFVADKSHGGRFLSVGEAPNGSAFNTELGDPIAGIANGLLTATITYTADDDEYIE